ncbi:tuberoinfundibular peptide of 39 residues [Hyla sarda]|uniref:tuberoinfundibular peptide of 39 residues n=1 Tax=Hyla sarda TaxID=327740 RepID=UPI0024C3567E|nr:tuberoinfundibular peptide of 39 residues [Hyla sarda]XP_056398579.1 tuberoinfundibular peptide of 39 residues [Hyla sarda]XP_056398580.1 tuberoinfundibular peptide of 39 residues [Hyla sarda]XP_056398581.1 tuberoinfundibular peptide of 39 residues [Hyla sarda]XP_056398582.1 tuberoinfundibular peptide of 39 residues [Hyla sarda]XP_056398585.1 tuberoinfundibular peptide of 39 residues [Hyla sarda]XP_056398586.1 tuberoinfundibular peptide of 39 residues [Hyla sarda]XP_056398587.1 tuberoinfu
MEKIVAGRGFLLITVLLGYCIVWSSSTIIPTIRNPGRLWKRDLSYQSLNDKELNPFLSGPDSWNQVPSITFHDWSIKMLSSDMIPNETPDERAGKLLMLPITRQLMFGSNDIQKRFIPDKVRLNRGMTDQRWLPMWPANEEMEKRSIVVADDAAFREKSKMLTAMERQKWLNSYMQKLLVFNST